MIFEEQSYRLADGRTCLLRPPFPSDAEGMLQTLRALSEQTNFLLRVPDECTETVSEEAEYLTQMLESRDKAMILAIVSGEIAGWARVLRHTRAKTRHRCDIGLAIKKEYWHLGIGGKLMDLMVDLARHMGCMIMELECIAGNQRAIRLYERYGFVVNGRRINGLRQPDGSFADEILMQKTL